LILDELGGVDQQKVHTGKYVLFLCRWSNDLIDRYCRLKTCARASESGWVKTRLNQFNRLGVGEGLGRIQHRREVVAIGEMILSDPHKPATGIHNPSVIPTPPHLQPFPMSQQNNVTKKQEFSVNKWRESLTLNAESELLLVQ
jgi:hypothetical protein